MPSRERTPAAILNCGTLIGSRIEGNNGIRLVDARVTSGTQKGQKRGGTIQYSPDDFSEIQHTVAMSDLEMLVSMESKLYLSIG